MHFAESSLDGQIFSCGIGMRCHNSDNRGVARIIAWCNDAQNDVFTCEYSSYTFAIHDEDCSCMVLLHQTSCFTDCCADVDECRRRGCLEDRREVRACHFGAEVREIIQHLLGLGNCSSPFSLHTFKSIVEFLRRRICSFKLRSVMVVTKFTFSIAS